MAAQRIALQHLLQEERRRGEAFPHFGLARRQPHLHANRNLDYLSASRPFASFSTASMSIPPSKMIPGPEPSTMSMRGGAGNAQSTTPSPKSDADRPRSPARSVPSRPRSSGDDDQSQPLRDASKHCQYGCPYSQCSTICVIPHKAALAAGIRFCSRQASRLFIRRHRFGLPPVRLLKRVEKCA
jgi:hypothetical protein